VLPVEITHEALRIATYDESTSNEALQDDVDSSNEAISAKPEKLSQYLSSAPLLRGGRSRVAFKTGRSW
jgi:hypothetical protein